MDHSPNSLVPLTLLALEVGIAVDELAARLDDDVIIDAAGMRAIPTDRCAAFIAARRAAALAEADRRAAARDGARRRPNAVRERLAARRRAEEQLGQIGAPGEPLAAGTALAVLQQIDGSRDRQLDDAAAQRDEQTSGKIVYRRIHETQE